MKQYFEAVKIWEEHRKNVYIPNISTYEVILRLCQSISSSPALEEVRKDMASVGVVMDVACGLTYVWTLLSLDMAEEALNFIQQELTLKVSTICHMTWCNNCYRVTGPSLVSVPLYTYTLATPLMACMCVRNTSVQVSVLMMTFTSSVFTVVSLPTWVNAAKL